MILRVSCKAIYNKLFVHGYLVINFLNAKYGNWTIWFVFKKIFYHEKFPNFTWLEKVLVR